MPNSDSSFDRDPCVLILEDSATLVTQISRALRAQFPSMQILAARGVAEAQVLAAEYPVDLFLLDIHLPDGSGIDFLCDVKTEHAQAKVIIMTAVPLAEYREQAQNLGVLRFIEKPLDLPKLCEQIGRAIGVLDEASERTSPDSFQGSLSSLTPVDIIQLKCLGRACEALDFICSDNRRGRIYFKNGEVVHAETGSARGTAAFNEIVSWRGGRVVEVKNAPEALPTIREHWQFLLMNAAQLMDEQGMKLAS